MEVTIWKVSEEQGDFMKGKSNLGQIFTIKKKLWKTIQGRVKNSKQLSWTEVDRETLWNILKIYGVEGQLLEAIKAFQTEAIECIAVGVRQGCVMLP